MGKRTIGRHGAKPAFRESDFAGRPAQEQAELSGSLNQLSLQLAASRKMLQDIEVHTSTTASGSVPQSPQPPAANPHEGLSSDDDTAVSR